MTIVTHGRRTANIPQMWGTGRRVPAVIVEVMTADHPTEAPAAAGTRVLLETTRATWRFTAIRGLLSIGALERLTGGPLTTGELAGRCGASPGILRRVLRCVAATGLLRSAGPQRYELTGACRAVMDGRAFAGLLFNAGPGIWNALGEITETIRTGQAPLIDRYGGLYGYLATRPATAAGFDALVKGNDAPAASALTQAIDFAELGSQRSFRPSVNRRMTEVTPSTADHHMPAHDASEDWSPQSGNGGVSCSL